MPKPSAGEELAEPAGGTFDTQGQSYDARAGLPASAGLAVAKAIVAVAGLTPAEMVVELGAGTGEMGIHLARLPLHYVGLDNSAQMLAAFRAKAGEPSPTLIVADCDRSWPVPDGSTAVVFASRVIHLLDPAHVARETMRVCRPGGLLILGRVRREPESLKERLRRQRQRLLREAGIAAREGEAGGRQVIERCVQAGGESLGRSAVAEWQGETSAAAILAGWELQTRMGSVAVDAATRARILDKMRAWARAEIGDLDHAETFREHYAIDIVRLPQGNLDDA